MIMKYFCTVMIAIALVGCTATPSPTQKAQQSKVSPTRTLDMEALCKAQVAQRYNTGAQKIAVTGFEQFQGSYEMRGNTFRKESFVCSFDADGQFLHLFMR
ncbi:YsaB family lipoprotein [Salmonella enterica]